MVHRYLRDTEVDESASAKFLQEFLSLFVGGANVTMRELFFRNIASEKCVSGSIDVVVGKPTNGGKPVITFPEGASLQTIVLACVAEAKPQLSGGLPGSTLSPGLELLAIYQPMLQLCAISEMCKFTKRNIPVISFYGSHQSLRPFIYFREYDVMLSTVTALNIQNSNSSFMHSVAFVKLMFMISNFNFTENKLRLTPKTGWKLAKTYNAGAYMNAQLVVQEDGDETDNPIVMPPPIANAAEILMRAAKIPKLE